MLPWLKNLTMRKQITFFYLSIFLSIMGIVSIGNYVQFQIFNYTSTTPLSKIVYREDLKEIGQVSTIISNFLKYKYQRNIQLIDHLALFIFLYSQNEESFSNKHVLDQCVQSMVEVQNIEQFCYIIHEVQNETIRTNDEQRLFLMKSLSFLDQFGLSFNIYLPNFLQIVDLSKNTFDSLFPYGIIDQEYNPTQRPWYLSHIQGMKEYPAELYFFSDVFQQVIDGNSFQIAITQSILNQNKETFGIIKTQLNISEQDFFNIQHNILLINQYGQVLYNGLDGRNNISEVFYIYNESITGFNMSDWHQIEMTAAVPKANNNNYYNDSTNFLYDKFADQYVQIHSEKFKKQNFTLITYTNRSSIILIKEKIEKIEDALYYNIYLASIVLTICASSFLIITLFLIKQICLPLKNLNNQISQHLLSLGNNTNQEIFKIIHQNHSHQDVVRDFNFKFQNFYDMLQNNQLKKSEQCRLYEQMKYNKLEGIIDLKLIKLEILNVENNNQKFISFRQLLN